MAKKNEVASLGGGILASAAKILEQGENRYRPSEEWNDGFPSNVKGFQRKLEIWEAEYPKFQVSNLSVKNLVETLQTAKSTLSAEEANLKKKTKRSRRVGCFSTMGLTLFPAQLASCLKIAVQAFDEVSDALKSRQVSVQKLEAESPSVRLTDNRFVSKPMSTPKGYDNRHVVLKASEEKLCWALNKPHGEGERPAVVLLHGGAGEGKSTLARYVTRAHYILNRSAFDIVRLLECGPQATSLEKKLELLQLLGSDTITPEELEREENLEGRIERRLLALLGEKKILLLLDDVWDEQFLQRIVDLCGSRVKCLVTAQEATLCDNLNCSSVDKVEMQDVSLESAREILACHVQFQHHEIPQHLKEVADKMIGQTGSNPLALASLAGVIDEKRENEVEEWEAVSDDLVALLKSEQTETTLGKAYPRSFLSTMRLTVDSLPPQGQKLLLLTSMCDQLSIPEEVISILYESLNVQGDTRTFSKFRDELENRGLLKVSSSSKRDNTATKVWSLHSLQKRFLGEEFKDRVESIFNELINNKEIKSVEELKSENGTEEQKKANIVATLCVVYFDETFAKKAASKVQIALDDFNKLRKEAIEPIILLLGHPVSDLWTESLKASASKVVLKYISNGELDNHSMAHLLGLPASKRVALRAFHDVSLIEETPLLDTNHQVCLKALVGFLAEDADKRVTGLAAATLSNLAVHCVFTSFPGILEGLVRLLDDDDHPEIQISCARALADLAKNDSAGCSMIIEYKGALDLLVGLLAADEDPILQQEVARALGMLACGPGKISVTIVNAPRALPGLVTLLGKEDNKPLQVSAAWALTCLVIWGGKSKQTIIQHPEFLPDIFKMSLGTGNPDLQNFTGIMLSILAETEETRSRVAALDGLKESCQVSLADHDSFSGVHRWAASTLTYVDHVQGNGTKLVSYDAFLERARANLVLGLYKQSVKDLKRCALLDPEDPTIFSNRCTVKGMLKDFDGALVDADLALKLEQSLPGLTERGFLKRVKGDLDGALTDFNEALKMETVYIHSLKYEALKQRGYVKFLMNDVEGARADAEAALKCEPPRADEIGYGSCALDQTAVKYLDYYLK